MCVHVYIELVMEIIKFRTKKISYMNIIKDIMNLCKYRKKCRKYKIADVKISVWPKFKRGGELNPFIIFSQICFSM